MGEIERPFAEVLAPCYPEMAACAMFYDSLTKPHRQMVDASCGGTFMIKSENEARTLFDNLIKNSVQHASTSRRTPRLKRPKIFLKQALLWM